MVREKSVGESRGGPWAEQAMEARRSSGGGGRGGGEEKHRWLMVLAHEPLWPARASL